jgi:hypothetical protein
MEAIGPALIIAVSTNRVLGYAIVTADEGEVTLP